MLGELVERFEQAFRLSAMARALLEAMLNSEFRTLGQPRVALLGFAIAVPAYNDLSC